MPRVVMVYTSPILRLADTQAGLAAGDAWECQLTSAVITPAPVITTIPATGCAPATDSPGATKFALDLAWLQDWSAPGGGLSGYAWDRAGDEVWFELLPDAADTAVKASGTCFVVEGAVGGTFGDGSAGTASASWPCTVKPTLASPAVAATASSSSSSSSG